MKYDKAKKTNSTGVNRAWLCLLNAIFSFGALDTTRPRSWSGADVAESEIYFWRAVVLSEGIDTGKAVGMEAGSDSHPTCDATIRWKLTTGAVQSCLILSQYAQGTDRLALTWRFHGVALRMATQLGLYSNSVLAHLDPLAVEIRKRTWFGCVLLDR